jgi:hypothetical protein
VNEQGNVWRIFFYEKHTNGLLNHLLGLNSLKEIWLLGSKVTEVGVEELKKEKPNATVYF